MGTLLRRCIVPISYVTQHMHERWIVYVDGYIGLPQCHDCMGSIHIHILFISSVGVVHFSIAFIVYWLLLVDKTLIG